MKFYNINDGGYLGGLYRRTNALPGIKSLTNTPYALPRNNLVLHLDASDLNSYPGSGTTWTDISGSRINATLTSTSFNADYGGMINMSSSGYATLGNNFAYDDENFSMMFHYFWTNNALATVINEGNSFLFSKGSYVTSGYYLRLTPQGQLIFTTETGSATHSTATGGSVLMPQQSHIVTIVRNGTSVVIYVNGVNVNNIIGTHSNPLINTNNFRIGANITPNAYTRGQYGFFLIYQRALSADEVSTIYDLYRLRYGI